MIQNVEAMVYNGYDLEEIFSGEDTSEEYLIFENVRGRDLLTQDAPLILIPGRDGAYQSRTRKRERPLEVDIALKGSSFEDVRRRLELLSDILLVDEPVPITFKDESERTYYGLYVDREITEERSKVIKLTLFITCPDPYKYGPEVTRLFFTDVKTFSNEGTAPAKPIFELTAKESVTYALIQNEHDKVRLGGEVFPKYTMIGRPHEVDETPFERYQRRYYTDANTLVGWTKASESDIDGGLVTGEIVSRNDRFIADSYGEGSNWHGPAIKTSIDSPIRDFRLSAFVGFMNRAQATMVGRLEIYLLDVNGNAVAKMALKDTSAVRANVWAEMRAGDRDDNEMIIHDHGSRVGSWNNFSGQLRISREWDEEANENIWSAYVAMVDTRTRRHHGRRIVSEWRDGGRHSRNVAQIVVHFGTVGNHTPIHANSGVSSIILQEIVKRPEGVPYIAHAGDKIVFDSTTGDAFINGEPRNDLLDLGSDFVDLVRGENMIVVHPNSFETELRYRERFT